MSIPTSYFSEPSSTLDTKLFQGRQIRSWVRTGVLHLLYGFLDKKYRHAELWSHAWLAGSGVSYQWAASRSPGDLDCLVGVDFVQFRKANPEFSGLSDQEIADELNEGFKEILQPNTEDWNGYELTFYVNPSATDIRTIKPYAAYDLKYNEWTVHPDPNQGAEINPEWEGVADNDRDLTTQITTRFNAAIQDIQSSRNDANRRNAETKLSLASQQGTALFNELHENRSQAFSPVGQGYGDFHNYRWQAGKRLGTIQDLRRIKEYSNTLGTDVAKAVYGVELPNSSTLIRRAALQRNNI